MTGVVAVVCICGLLSSPLLYLVSGRPRMTALLRIREEDVVRWQFRSSFSVATVALLGLIIVLLA